MNRQQRRRTQRAARRNHPSRSGIHLVGAPDREVVVDGGHVIAKLPADLEVEPETLVWVGLNPGCGCAWGWSADEEQLRPEFQHKLFRAVQVEGLLDHTAAHHLTPHGFSMAHLPVPGHDD